MTDKDKQSNRPFKHLSDKYMRKATGTPNGAGEPLMKPESFNLSIIQLMEKIQIYQKGNTIDDNILVKLAKHYSNSDTEFFKDSEEGQGLPNIQDITAIENHLRKMKQHVKAYYDNHEAVINEEAVINRIEGEAHRRTTAWRTFAAALFSAVLVITYTGASYLSNHFDALEGLALPFSSIGKVAQCK